MKVAAIIPAAGIGRRMQHDTPKQYLSLGGKPILANTLAIFEDMPEITEIIVVAQPEALDLCQKQVITPFGFKKVLRLVPGGKERQDSVYNALKVLHRQNDWDLILVHDGVRPLVTEEEVRQVIRAAAEHGAAILALPAQDTVKKVNRRGQDPQDPESAGYLAGPDAPGLSCRYHLAGLCGGVWRVIFTARTKPLYWRPWVSR